MMCKSILVRPRRGSLPLPPIEGKKDTFNKILESLLLLRPPPRCINRRYQFRKHGLRFRFGHQRYSAQRLRFPLNAFSPSRHPRAVHFLQTTFLKPPTHAQSPHAPTVSIANGAIVAHVSLSRFHCSRVARRTRRLRIMETAGRGDAPATFPAITLYTCAFEQRSSRAISSIVRISLVLALAELVDRIQ